MSLPEGRIRFQPVTLARLQELAPSRPVALLARRSDALATVSHECDGDASIHIADVTVVAPDFLTPRSVIQVCSASITTITPTGFNPW